MRTFVAIELNETCRKKLRDAVDDLAAGLDSVRWVGDEAMHLTLKFIGELDEGQIPRAVDAIEGAAAGLEPFDMVVSGIGAFPPKGRPRVIWAGVEEGSEPVVTLAELVEEALADSLGLKRERRRFIPHVTLGRVKGGPCPSANELAARVRDRNFGRVRVEDIVLMKSDLTPQGAVYTVLNRSPLSG